MPQEITLARTIAGCTPAEYFDCIYGDPEFFKWFHEVENKDPNAEVGPWVDGVRQLAYTLPVNLPASAKRLVGLDAIQIKETQTTTWTSPDISFIVESAPSMNFPGSAKFTTAAHVTVTKVEDGCEVICRARCEAGLPWPMASAVESIMAQQAQVSIGTFLDCCVRQIAAQASTVSDAFPPTPHPAPPVAAAAAAAATEAATAATTEAATAVAAAAAAAAAHTTGSEDATGGAGAMEPAEVFWDATDVISMMSGIDTSDESQSHGFTKFEDAILVQLRSVSTSCSDCSKALESISGHLADLSQAARPPRRSGRRLAYGLLALTSCAAVLVYMRGRHSLVLVAR